MKMSTQDTPITTRTCRFCLSSKEKVQSIFDRFATEEVREHFHGALGIELDPACTYNGICDECAGKVTLLFSLMVEFRKANTRFCSLLEKNQQKDALKDNSPTNIEVRQQKIPFDDETGLQESRQSAERITGLSLVKEVEDLDDDELIEEDSFEDVELSDELTSELHDEQIGFQNNEIISVCYVCNAFSGSQETCNNHVLQTHGHMVPYRCEKCEKVLEDVLQLNKHLRTHQSAFGCLYCVRTFSSKAELHEHGSDCVGYSCEGCGESFLFVSLLKDHICKSSKLEKLHIVNLLARSDGKCKSPIPTCCVVCNEEFTRNASLALHMEREHSSMSAVLHCCDLCPQKFTSLGVARKHRISHKKHQTARRSRANECAVCLERFKFNRELLQHLEKAHADVTVTLHRCAKCDRKFTTQAKLQKHDYNTHQGRQPKFFCSFCGRVFNKRIGLQDHENTHRGVKEYRCYACNRHFAYKSSYDRHMQVVHSDTKQFTCEHCQKSFKRKPTLKVHLRLHTGEKPYQCEFCSRRFVDPSSFHKHKQKDHTLLGNCLIAAPKA